MWSRVLCVLVVLLAAPLSATAASRCCDASDTCCDDDAPSCPILPGGECALASAGHAQATLHASPHVAPPMALVAAAPLVIASGEAPRTPSSTSTHSGPPRFLLLRSLRN